MLEGIYPSSAQINTDMKDYGARKHPHSSRNKFSDDSHSEAFFLLYS